MSGYEHMKFLIFSFGKLYKISDKISEIEAIREKDMEKGRKKHFSCRTTSKRNISDKMGAVLVFFIIIIKVADNYPVTI